MSKITQSAKGEDCQIRVPGVCNHRTETTVLAHLNGGGGGMKHPDCEASYACSSCHDVIDGRVKSDYRRDEVNYMLMEGCVRTRKILIDKGLLILK